MDKVKVFVHTTDMDAHTQGYDITSLTNICPVFLGTTCTVAYLTRLVQMPLHFPLYISSRRPSLVVFPSTSRASSGKGELTPVLTTASGSFVITIRPPSLRLPC